MVRKNKQSGSWWSELNIFNVLLIIFGIRAVYDRPQKNGSRFSYIGIIFAIIHTVFGGMIFDMKYFRLRVISIVYNKVIFGTLFLQLLLNLLVPIFINLCSIWQFSDMTIFLDKIDLFTKNIENKRGDLAELKRKKVKVTRVTYISLLIYTAINIVLAIYHYRVFYGSDIYQILGLIYYAVIALTNIHILGHLYEISLRFDLFKELLDNIKFNYSSNRQFDVIPNYSIKYFKIQK